VDYYSANPYRAIEFLKPRDYIKEPKADGYRSYHLICRYQGTHQKGAYKGLRIEIQIRSTMQHAWATAVETIDAFTGQALKTNILGDATWKRFFSLMSSGIAILEKQPPVPSTPLDIKELCAELRDVCERLNVPNVFYGLSAGMALTKTVKSPAGIYILTLDSEERSTRVVGFPTANLADERYLEMEKENKDKSHIQTVMVKLDSIRELRRAYPGYYSDTQRFIRLVESFCVVVK
jgi:RelA/SpoT family protein